MIINIASHNPNKIEALREIIRDYDNLQPATVVDVDSLSGVSEQPISLDETIKGAINRAQESFRDCQYSVGLESRLMSVPYT